MVDRFWKEYVKHLNPPVFKLSPIPITDEMVERAARALAGDWPKSENHEVMVEIYCVRDTFREWARAALTAALRESET